MSTSRQNLARGRAVGTGLALFTTCEQERLFPLEVDDLLRNRCGRVAALSKFLRPSEALQDRGRSV
jgi:hypothetical protein